MQDLIRHKGKLNLGSDYIFFLYTGQDNMYVDQKRVVRKHKTWKKCRHDQNGFAFYKEKKLTVLSTDAFYIWQEIFADSDYFFFPHPRVWCPEFILSVSYCT